MTRTTHVSADPKIRSLLAQLSHEGAEVSAASADEAFARVVWARLAEPADAAAGTLLSALGPSTALDLLVSGASAKDLHRALGEAAIAEIGMRTLAAGIKRWFPRLNREASLTDLERAAAHNMRLIDPASDSWPVALNDLGHHAPLLLWVRGNPALLSTPALAVVGARACTGYGSHVTAEFTDAACSAGATIVSGAAYGVDAVAHRTALAASAATIAVVAGGADRTYPAAHEQLLGSIAKGGVVCSEMVPGSAPTRWRFLMRNRIIAALAVATLVTEAGARSGSLNTAGHAAELGRPLGAVPGPVSSAASTGCHRLIREYGASLITSGPDVLDLMGIDPANGDLLLLSGSGAESSRQPSVHQRVLDALPLRGARTIAEAAQHAGLSPEETQTALAELELLGEVTRRETPQRAEQQWALKRRE